MGQYGAMGTCPREFREDADLDAGELIAAQVRAQAEAEGYHPAGDPRVDWYEITQQEVEYELAAQEAAGIKDPSAGFRAGDWRVRIIIDVTEDAELPV